MRASLVVLGATAFMSQANARVIDSLLHVALAGTARVLLAKTTRGAGPRVIVVATA
jgi:hypothetical protein